MKYLRKLYRRWKWRKRDIAGETLKAWEPYMADGVFGERPYGEMIAMQEYFRRMATDQNNYLKEKHE